MRILIIEDDKELNNGLKMALESEGYAVDTYFDGQKSERHILMNHSNYDLIVLDFMLPGKNGIELTQTLRSAEIYVPILMLTGVTDTDNKITALNAGADDYQTKPFSMEELIARVRALLRRPRESLPLEIKTSSITLNTTNKKVFFHGTEIKLTLKEYSILEYLMRNKGMVMSRDQILDHVWDFATNAFSNIVDVHITNLRKKLEKNGAPNVLETIRGIGFTIQ